MLVYQFDRRNGKLPEADMVIANLLVEYIGYECFQKTIQQVYPKYVSCIIQINMEEQILKKTMKEIDYHTTRTLEHMLPNGKKLVLIDFER